MIGKTLIHYEITAELGKGGMGEVYQAKDTKLGRDVAIKVLPEEFALDKDRVARFQREAKLLASLNHPNIAAIHGLEESEGTHFLVMELIEGDTLKDRIKSGPIPVEEALKLALQMAEALEAAHENGVIHRDLKPANVMVTQKGLVKVLDYGLAKLTSPSSMNSEETTRTIIEMTEEGKVLGTVAYMSPEQVEGKRLDARSDVFSFGLVFYEMLAGQPAFSRDSRIAILSAILRDAPASIRAIQPKVPSSILAILERCLEKDREGRYASATELRRALAACKEQIVFSGMKSKTSLRRKRFLVPAAILLLALTCVVALFWIRSSRVNWALNVALPQIELTADKSDYAAAYNMAKQAQKYISGNARLAELLDSVSIPITLETDVPGAEIQFKEYADVDGSWQQLGRSPLKDVVVSRGLKRWRISRPGFRTKETVWSPEANDPMLRISLDEESQIPDGMVRVPAADAGVLSLTGFDHIQAPALNDYLIDTYEVTNKQYAEFVAAGGYRQPKFWKHRFVKNGGELSWQEAIAEFRDSTGQPGPATWEFGSYIKGQENFPVAGVSWYEAAAYAEFAGKTLPSIYHWNHSAWTTAGFMNISPVVRLSNFAGKGPARRGQFPSLNAYGTYDMAGNVKEWCWNATDAGGERRYILGGAWNDPEYLFHDPEAQPAMSRLATFGFRCVKYLSDIPVQLLDAAESARREYAKETPVADDIFRIYQSFYSYDKTSLKPVVESVNNTSEYWITEKVTLNAAYGGERLILYLFLPRGVEPPYQTIVFFPPSTALRTRSFQDSEPLNILFDFIVRSGRSVVYPVYKSTYERGDGLLSDRPNLSSRFRDHVIQWYKDFARSVDYLESRKDFDTRKLGYYGVSWGAAMGPIVLAQDTRIKAAVLAVGGFWQQKSLPEVDQINFASRVKIPVLMLNGKFDFIFPVETSQAPMFRLMQTLEQDRRHLLYDSGHMLLRKDLVIETLQWYDRYLGPAK